MRLQAGCDFCHIAASEEPARIVRRGEKTIAFFPTEPATLGHTLLIPTIHVPDIWSLNETTAAELARATLHLAHALRKALRPDGLNIIQSNGEAATQTVAHLHVHVVPRWTDDAMGLIWPTGMSWSAESKSNTLRALRDALGED